MSEEVKTFEGLGLSEASLAAIGKKGFESPTPIQRMAIPVLLGETCDVIGQAQTGTGKTAAFGLPILESIDVSLAMPQALVLAPTRELALQVADELTSLRGDGALQVLTVYGGQSISEQLRRLSRGAHIVVGTPGRVLDVIKRGRLPLDQAKWAVLDEADEMLNMGFIEDVEEILSHVTGEHRTLLFSATMPDRIVKLAKRFMRDPKLLEVDKDQKPTTLADQIYFEVRAADKFDALTRIIDIEPEFYGLVFCRTRNDVDELTMRLAERGYSVEGLHGEITQAQREKTLNKFRKRLVNILVATDVAARGIDIADLSHVINYSLPQDPESYVHRVGRTGRAGKEGTAITFVTPQVSDIVEVKWSLILDGLSQIVSMGQQETFLPRAEEVLSQYQPKDAVAALLHMAYRNVLDASNYEEVRSFTVDKRGSTRLFVAVGKRDGYSPKSLVEYLCAEAKVSSRDIDDVTVLEEYSFVTVPFEEAKRILDAFSRIQVGGKPMVEKAKNKN